MVGLYRLKFPNSIWAAALRHSCHASEVDEPIGAPPRVSAVIDRDVPRRPAGVRASDDVVEVD